MDFSFLWVFIPSCFALNMIPGPSNLLSMNHGRCYGFVPAVLGGAGRLLAFSLMIILAASGLAMILYSAEWVFFSIKVLGSGYLLWVAVKLWTSKANLVKEQPTGYGLLTLMKREFLLAAANPKAILIFTAFFPQFVDPTINVVQQFAWLGLTFLLFELVAISVYALSGAILQLWLTNSSVVLIFNRCCGMILGGLALRMLTAAPFDGMATLTEK